MKSTKMFSPSVLVLLQLTSIIQKITGQVQQSELAQLKDSAYDTNDRLILTPLLKAGDIHGALSLAKVHNWTKVESYSGFFTVNRKYNSNIFFWFFPATVEPKTAPLILWLQGGPGVSGMFGTFVENGPFVISKTLELTYRNTSWTRLHSVIFIDNPVGVGFSFTDNSKGYVTSSVEAMDHAYEVLQQFYLMFPEYRQNSLYLFGESYGGKYVPNLALKIHEENVRLKSSGKINLKGIGIGNALIEPIRTLTYSQHLHALGLVDEAQSREIAKAENMVKDYVKKGKNAEAYQIIEKIIGMEMFGNFTGSNYIYGILQTRANADNANYIHFLNLTTVLKSIHVGNTKKFIHTSDKVFRDFNKDIVVSTSPMIVKLLKAKYRVLLYAGNLDALCTPLSIENTIHYMKWKWIPKWKLAKRHIWAFENEVVGYVKSYRKLTFIVIRNAGHNVPAYQPEVTHEMIEKFTRGRAIVSA